MGLWIGLWIASIAVGVGLYFAAGPAIPGMDEKTERLRKGILISGFVPCFGITIINSLVFFALYKARSHGVGARQLDIQRRLERSEGFGAAPARDRDSSPGGGASDNPFL